MCYTTGQRIKMVRKAAAMTQEQLGAELGISGSMIAKYETDKRNPKQETIQRISVALGCDFYWLLWEESLSFGEKSGIDTIRVFNFTSPRDQKIVELATKRMEYVLKAKGYSLDDDEAKFIGKYSKLNIDGKTKAADILDLITEIPRYRAETAPEGSAGAAGNGYRRRRGEEGRCGIP